MKTNYVIVDEELGVYLGSYDSEMFEGMLETPPPPDKKYAAFAGCNPFGVVHALTFEKKESAEIFMYSTFPKDMFNLKVIPVELHDDCEAASVIDMIKNGYGEYTADMLDAWIPDTETMH